MSCDAGQNDHRAVDEFGLAEPPKLSGFRCYTNAITIGAENRAATSLDEPYGTLGLLEVHFLDADGEVIGWTDRITNVAYSLGANQFNNITFSPDGYQDWSALLSTHQVLVLADGSTVYPNGAEAPPMFGNRSGL
jgi:hypothetical protein